MSETPGTRLETVDAIADAARFRTRGRARAMDYAPHTIITIVIVSLLQIIEALLPDSNDKIIEAIRLSDANSAGRQDGVLESIRLSDANSAARHQRLYDRLSQVHTDVLIRRQTRGSDVPVWGLDYDDAWTAVLSEKGQQ